MEIISIGAAEQSATDAYLAGMDAVDRIHVKAVCPATATRDAAAAGSCTGAFTGRSAAKAFCDIEAAQKAATNESDKRRMGSPRLLHNVSFSEGHWRYRTAAVLHSLASSHVHFASLADITARNTDVRLLPKADISGGKQCPLSANSGHPTNLRSLHQSAFGANCEWKDCIEKIRRKWRVWLHLHRGSDFR